MSKKFNDISQEKRTFKYFTIMYIVALSVIALVTVFSQILIQRYLSNQVDDSHVINFAARLRTYSQTLGKTALLIESGRDIETNRKDFVNTLKQWQKSHQGLMSGSDFLNLPVNDREEMEQMFKIIEMPYKEIVDASNGMIDELYSTKPLDSMNIQPYIRKILQNEKAYLLGMELIVFDYDRFSREGVKKLKEVEYMLLGFVLTTLFLEALFIFAPLARRIKRIIKGLVDSEKNATGLAGQLTEMNNNLEKSHRELREINFALDKATYMVKTDKNGHIIYANDKYCYVSKYSLTELRGKPLFYNNDGGNKAVIYSHINDKNYQREVWQGEVFDHASDGTGFWLDVTMIPVIDHKGKLYQYLVICSDITRRKNTERELHLLMEEKLLRQQQEQKLKSYSIINGQEKERKRIAAEIHDGIGQMLTSVRMKLEMVGSNTPEVGEEVAQVNDLFTSVINETKRICSDLLPSVLDDFGLSAAIKEQAKMISETTSIETVLENHINAKHIERELEIGVYRIFQEAINNVLKHAEATKLFINIDTDGQFLNLIIEDNGKGFYFEEKSFFSAEAVRKANGLRNMKERAELLGGTFTITSEPGKGTIVQLEVPLPHGQDKNYSS